MRAAVNTSGDTILQQTVNTRISSCFRLIHPFWAWSGGDRSHIHYCPAVIPNSSTSRYAHIRGLQKKLDLSQFWHLFARSTSISNLLVNPLNKVAVLPKGKLAARYSDAQREVLTWVINSRPNWNVGQSVPAGIKNLPSPSIPFSSELATRGFRDFFDKIPSISDRSLRW